MYITFSEDLFEWFESETLRLKAEGGLKQELLDFYNDFLEAFLVDFDVAQISILQAISLAEVSAELSWNLFLRHCLVVFWLHYDQLQLALPMALSLQSLLEDERFSSSPLFPYACQDISFCYLLLDPIGYYKEIMATSQNVLTSVSLPHISAVSAYCHMLQTSASLGYTRQTECWLVILQSFEALSLDFAFVYEKMGCWLEAKSAYLKSLQRYSSEESYSHSHILSLLGAARACCALDDSLEAGRLLTIALSLFSASSHGRLLARLFEVQAYFALTCQHVERAVSFLTQASLLYLEFSWYRNSALCGLQAAELARFTRLFVPLQALSCTSKAASMLPADSQDIQKRLLSFACAPLPDSCELLLSPKNVSWRQLEERNITLLKTSLRVSIASAYIPLISRFLFLLAQLYLELHRDFHLAIQYLAWHIAVEYFHRSLLSLDAALFLLVELNDEYSLHVITDMLLSLATSFPPDWLLKCCEELSGRGWRAFVVSLIHFLSAQSPKSPLNKQFVFVPFSS